MRLFSFLRPKAFLTEDEIARGLRVLTWEGAASQGFSNITTSGMLAAFALALGASNTEIGVLAAAPFITQLLQIPAVSLIDRFRLRKAITVLALAPAQLIWFAIALVPFIWRFLGPSPAVALIVLMFLRGALLAVGNLSWNTWMRDLLPQKALGQFFSNRMSLAAVTAVIFGLGGGLFIDQWMSHAPAGQALYGYSIVFFAGTVVLALASPVLLLWAPEPRAQALAEPPQSLRKMLAPPFRNKNYRMLVRFLFVWSLVSNVAIPFFTIYMLQRIGLPLSLVVAFSLVSQIFNILFIRVWGRLADKYGSKVVLAASASLYLLVINSWALAILPGPYLLKVPFLVMLHVFAGVASAGVTLTITTISLKLAPQGEGTSYLAVSSLATNVGAGLGPLLGGVLADYLSARSLSFTLAWADPSGAVQFPTITLTGFEFLFSLAFMGGMFSLTILRGVREEGEVTESVLLQEMMSRSTGIARAASSVPFLRTLTDFPFNQLRKVPGMYVALGVTAYQVAAMTEAAIVAALRAKTVVSTVVDSVSDTLEHLFAGVEDKGQPILDVAKQAARGALHSLDEISVNVGYLVRQTVVGVVRGVSGRKDAREDALSGAVYGVVQGAHETGASVPETVTQAMEAVRQVAPSLGMDETSAMRLAAHAALDAGHDLGQEAYAEVRSALENAVDGDVLSSAEESRRSQEPGAKGRDSAGNAEASGVTRPGPSSRSDSG